MRKVNKFDKVLLVGIFLMVVAIFVLAFVLKSNGGQCVINPYLYAQIHNFTNPFIPQILPP